MVSKPERSAVRTDPALALDEKQFLALVRELALVCGWMAYHTHDSRRSPAGFPDLIMVKPPAIIVAELKTGRRRPTPDQRAWLEALGQCPGIEAYLWKPENWAQIAARLSQGKPSEHSIDIPAHELLQMLSDLHWMARRYADGRSTYATSLLNTITKRLLAAGVPLHPTADQRLFAYDGIGHGYDGLTAADLERERTYQRPHGRPARMKIS